eukprot:3702974-Lingulodinium_polyedra.AAC.1
MKTCSYDRSARPFCASGGPPCQPCSRMRKQSGQVDSRVPDGRPRFQTCFPVFGDYLRHRRFYRFIMEAGLQLSKPCRGDVPDEPTP